MCVSNRQFSRRIPDWATLRGARRLADADSLMKDLLLTLLHLAVLTAKLSGPGGVRAVIAENLVLNQQLIVLRRGRQRAPNLTLNDRLLCGFGALFLSPGRIRKLAIALRPSTLLAFHAALVRRKYRRLFSSRPCPKKPGPKGPSGLYELVQYWYAAPPAVPASQVNPRDHTGLTPTSASGTPSSGAHYFSAAFPLTRAWTCTCGSAPPRSPRA